MKPYYAARGEERERRQYLYDLLALISRRKRAIPGTVPDSEEQGSGDEAELVYRDYNDRLASQGAIDFDDILLLAYRILTELPQVARLYTRMYRYVCVDEAQDLNETQYALIRVLAADNGNVLMVGDANQAIYGFNGSDRRFMLESFPADFRVTTHELRENYRSAKAVIRAANALYPESIDETQAPLNGLCEVQALDREDAEAEWIVAKIRALLDLGSHADIDGQISLDRMAVLARNRYVFGPLESRLEADGIPHYWRRTGSSGDLESDFGRAFDLGLRLLVNPRDRLHRGQLCGLLHAVTTEGDDSQDAMVQLCNWRHGSISRRARATPHCFRRGRSWPLIRTDSRKQSAACRNTIRLQRQTTWNVLRSNRWRCRICSISLRLCAGTRFRLLQNVGPWDTSVTRWPWA